MNRTSLCLISLLLLASVPKVELNKAEYPPANGQFQRPGGFQQQPFNQQPSGLYPQPFNQQQVPFNQQPGYGNQRPGGYQQLQPTWQQRQPIYSGYQRQPSLRPQPARFGPQEPIYGQPPFGIPFYY